MRIEVTGSGTITHGLSGTQHLIIPPGVYDTDDPDGLISEELAKFLIETTNGHAVEYKPKSTAKAAVVAVEKTPGQQNQEALKSAQAAQQVRLSQAKKDRQTEDGAKKKQE